MKLPIAWLLGLSCLLLSAIAGAAEDPLAAARQLAEAEQYAAALERLDALLQEQPGHVEALLLRGVMLTRQGHIDQAIVVFRQLADEHPERPEPHNNLAVLYAAERRYEDARDALQTALALQPKYDIAHENLGDIYAKLASESYERAYDLNRSNTRAQEKSTVVATLFEPAPSPPASHTDEAPQPASAPSAEVSEEANEAVQPVPTDTSPAPRTHQWLVEETCYRIEDLETEGDAQAVAQWFSQRGIQSVRGDTEAQSAVNYHVFLPPLESRAAARARVEQMKGEGIGDLIVLASGEHANGIALGVYSRQDGAQRRVRELQGLGYEAQVTPLSLMRQRYFLDLSPGAGVSIHEAEFQQAFPTRSLKRRACE